MKKTAIKVNEDTLQKLNQLKYMWGFKSQREVLIRLIEIAGKFTRADYIKEEKK